MTNGPCPNSSAVSITILATDNASFTYGGNTFCHNGTNPSPTGGLPGGTWTGSTGLVIDAVIGTINLASSTTGAHTVTYTTNGPCPNSNSLSITIVPAVFASFAFADTVLCAQGTASLSIAGGNPGIYTASPAGLVFIDNSTGEIDLATSAPGVYQLTYTTSGPCPPIATATVTVVLCGGLNSLEVAEHYKLYPNPNEGIFSIENKGHSGNVSIVVLDVLGKVVHQQQRFIGAGETTVLQLSQLPKGTYYVQLQQEKQLQTLKFTIH